MGEIRIEGAAPFHFPDNSNRRVKKVAESNSTRPDEDLSHKPENGIHTVDEFGNRLDISQEALDRLAAEEDQETEE